MSEKVSISLGTEFIAALNKIRILSARQREVDTESVIINIYLPWAI